MDNTIVTSDIGYQPHLDQHYMSMAMSNYFKQKLLLWRQELDDMIEIDYQALENKVPRQADEVEDIIIAQSWLERSQQLHRHGMLRIQINAALQRIDNGTYGYCEQTGDEIGVKRLQAWPIATLCLTVQAYQERLAKMEQDR